MNSKILRFIRYGFKGLLLEKFIIFFVSLFTVIFGAIFSFSVHELMDVLILHANTRGIIEMLGWLAILIGSIFIIQFLRAQSVVRISAVAQHRWLSLLWRNLLKKPLVFFRTYSVGDLLFRLQAISETIQFYRASTISLLLTGIFTLSIFVILIYIEPFLFLKMILIIGPFIMLLIVGLSVQYQKYKAYQYFSAQLASLSFQVVTGIAKIKTTASQSRVSSKWEFLLTQKLNRLHEYKILKECQMLFFLVLPNAVIIVLMFHLKAEALGVTFGVGKLLFFMMMFIQGVSGLAGLFWVISQSIPLVSIFDKISPLLEGNPIQEASLKPEINTLDGKIEVVGITFGYAQNITLLSDISFSIEPGQFLAIVGPSGCGKSTLLNLLLGFETPSKGSIFFDQHSIADVDLTSLRQNFGVVLQDGVLFTGDILSNIVGGLSLNEDQAWEAAELAGVAEDIRQMPMGMRTLLPDSGRSLSGGQRQRIMIARALVNRPKVVFLDEATSALDALSQAHVSAHMAALKMTRVVIAHRLSTIQMADCILVLDQGKIVQKGSYEELVSQEGLFQQLAQRQWKS